MRYLSFIRENDFLNRLYFIIKQQKGNLKGGGETKGKPGEWLVRVSQTGTSTYTNDVIFLTIYTPRLSQECENLETRNRCQPVNACFGSSSISCISMFPRILFFACLSLLKKLSEVLKKNSSESILPRSLTPRSF